MGREIRRVPPHWQHPKVKQYNPRTHQAEDDYRPIFNHDAQTAWEEWMDAYQDWLVRGFAQYQAEHPGDVNPEEPYRAFCAWYGMPPDPSSYRPRWEESEATWWQVYETVSEGTPVTPPFASKEELVEYLVANGDFWDQKRRLEGSTGMNCEPWTREQAQRFVERGFAFSLSVTHGPQGTVIKEPKEQ